MLRKVNDKGVDEGDERWWCMKKSKVSLDLVIILLEVPTGIEPVYAVLQTAA